MIESYIFVRICTHYYQLVLPIQLKLKNKEAKNLQSNISTFFKNYFPMRQKSKPNKLTTIQYAFYRIKETHHPKKPKE